MCSGVISKHHGTQASVLPEELKLTQKCHGNIQAWI